MGDHIVCPVCKVRYLSQLDENRLAKSESEAKEMAWAKIAVLELKLIALVTAYKFALESSNSLVCPNDQHTLGCKCACMTCHQRQRGQDEIATAEMDDICSDDWHEKYHQEKPHGDIIP